MNNPWLCECGRDIAGDGPQCKCCGRKPTSVQLQAQEALAVGQPRAGFSAWLGDRAPSAGLSWADHIRADVDFASVIDQCDRLLAVKGHDYTQGASRGADGRDRLKNFYRNAERLGLSARQVLAVYMNKHLDAIETYLKAGHVESEPIEGRICDAINYLLLLAKMMRVEAREKLEKNPYSLSIPVDLKKA